MSKKKIGIIAGAVAVVILILVGVNLYLRGDHSAPSVRLATGFEIGYGERIGLFDLVTAVSDESAYTISITAGGNVAPDGRSTVFDRAGNAQVEITAVDELGHTVVKTAEVKITDTKPPMLQVKDQKISLGDPIDYHTGITAEDEMDGNLTSQIQVDLSQVDETKAGIYPVIYSVSDSAGNLAVVRSALIIRSPEAEEVTLSQQSLSLEGNGHYQLTATVTPSAWVGEIDWTSSDERVAVVSDGLISWVGAGSCVISAQAGDATAQCQVTCGYVSVSAIQLNNQSLTLDYDTTASLKTAITPSNWQGEVTWVSSDPSVATVSDGEVTWAGTGECTITATADGKTATCTVICNEPEIESLDIEEEEINLSANGTYAVVPTILPEIWSGDVVWTSSDPTIATVENGLIRWVSAGDCTITATAGDCTDSVVVHCAERGTLGDLLDDLLGQDDDDTTPDHRESHQD